MRRLVNWEPARSTGLLLSLLPFALVLVAYAAGSAARLAENPADKLLPAFGTLAETLHQYVFEEDKRSGTVLFWSDTFASLARLGIALAVSAVLGLMLGVAIGSLPVLNRLLGPFVAVLSMVPPLAVLPILFIVLGLDEAAKITLIIIGITPALVRDVALRTSELPREQLVKAQTLGLRAGNWCSA